MNLELCNHPSQARHPFTNEPLFDGKKPVPLFPKQRAIRLDGFLIAYVSEHGNVNFLKPESVLTPAVCEAAKKLVEKEFKPVKSSHNPPVPEIEIETEEDEPE